MRNPELTPRVVTAVLGVGIALGCTGGSGESPIEPDPVVGPGDFQRELTVDGRIRSYSLHVPSQIGSGSELPLLIAFHGIPSDAEEMRRITDLDAVADARGFIVAYPNAIDNWNNGCEDCNSSSFNLGIDDVKFVRRLVDRLTADMPVDRRRIYGTGFSNGALFVHRLACDAADLFAALASVAATSLEPGAVPACAPSRPVSILFMHGTADPSFPPEGRTFGQEPFAIRSLSIDATVATWTDRNGCAPVAMVRRLPDLTNDGTTVHTETYSGCRDGVAIVYYAIEGGGHTWPGSPGVFQGFLGVKSLDIEASEEIADFFLSHSAR